MKPVASFHALSNTCAPQTRTEDCAPAFATPTATSSPAPTRVSGEVQRPPDPDPDVRPALRPTCFERKGMGRRPWQLQYRRPWQTGAAPDKVAMILPGNEWPHGRDRVCDGPGD